MACWQGCLLPCHAMLLHQAHHLRTWCSTPASLQSAAQVAVLQHQLHAMQALPVVLPSPYTYPADPWGLSVVPWAQPQPAVPLFQASAASVQHSCSVLPSAQATPISQPLIPASASPLVCAEGVSTAAVAPAGGQGTAAAGSPSEPGVSGAAASVEAAHSPSGELAAAPTPATQAPPQAAAQEQPPQVCGPPPGMQPGHGAAKLLRASAPAEVGWPEAAAVSAACGSVAGSPPSAQDELAAVASAEADIDRLIADAERAVSVLSCYSDEGWDCELAVTGGPSCAAGSSVSLAEERELPWAEAGLAPAAPAAGPAAPAVPPPLSQAGQASSPATSASSLVVRVNVPSFLQLDVGPGEVRVHVRRHGSSHL